MKPVDMWKRWVPVRHQRAVAEARLRLRARLDPARPLPDFLIIGAMRSGTSSMYKYLEQHPAVISSLLKETEYFAASYRRGERWYRAHFPSRPALAMHRRRHGRDPLAFEATPYYLFHPHAPARAAACIPEARLVVLLRDPVERAYSHHQHEVRRGNEDLPFDEAVEREEERLAPELARLRADPFYDSGALRSYSYLARGRYAEQLERWFEHFPPERTYLIRSEDLYAEPVVVYQQLLEFLDVPAWMPAEFRNYSYLDSVRPPMSAMSQQTRSRLQAYFAPHNRRLAELTGRDFGWGDG